MMTPTREQLVRIEWAGDQRVDYDNSIAVCPACDGGYPPACESNSHAGDLDCIGHKSDCWIAAALRADVEAPAHAPVTDLEMELRREWWFNHGHGFASLYGDDGEMQCHNCQQWDYRNTQLDVLRDQVVVARYERVARALTGPPAHVEGTPQTAATVDQQGNERWISGFLSGQVSAYCEMVNRGVRLAGAIDMPERFAAAMQADIASEGCLSKVTTASSRALVWIFRDPSVRAIIDAVDVAVNSPVGIWASGKLFGYGDADVLTFLGKSDPPKAEAAPPAPTQQYRADGWPLCPRCEADELADLVNVKADPTAELKCYVCQWTGTIPVAPAPTLVKAHAQQVGHRCSGCGHEWEGRLVGPELCGNCWRQVRPVLHGEAAPPAPHEVKCEACEAGYRLAADGLHYDLNDWTWGVCRKVVAELRGEAAPPAPTPRKNEQTGEPWSDAELLLLDAAIRLSDVRYQDAAMILHAHRAAPAPTGAPASTETCPTCHSPARDIPLRLPLTRYMEQCKDAWHPAAPTEAPIVEWRYREVGNIVAPTGAPADLADLKARVAEAKRMTCLADFSDMATPLLDDLLAALAWHPTAPALPPSAPTETPEAMPTVAERIEICERCQMRLPEHMGSYGMGVRGGTAWRCAACQPIEGASGRLLREKVIAERKRRRPAPTGGQ